MAEEKPLAGRMHVTFSHKSNQVALVRAVVDELARGGVRRECCFFSTTDHNDLPSWWQSQWLRAADESACVVFVIDEEYTQSTSCVREWNSVAYHPARRVVVGAAEDNRALEAIARAGRLTTDENGDLIMCVHSGLGRARAGAPRSDSSGATESRSGSARTARVAEPSFLTLLPPPRATQAPARGVPNDRQG